MTWLCPWQLLPELCVSFPRGSWWPRRWRTPPADSEVKTWYVCKTQWYTLILSPNSDDIKFHYWNSLGDFRLLCRTPTLRGQYSMDTGVERLERMKINKKFTQYVRVREWAEALKVNLHHDGFALRGGDVHVRDRPTFRLCRLPLASSRSQIPNSQYPNPKWRPVQGGSYATSWVEKRKRAERRGEHGNQLSRVFTWWLVMISDPIYLWIDISLSLTINLQYIKLRWNFFLSANFRDQRTENSRLNLFFLLYGNLKTLIEERS